MSYFLKVIIKFGITINDLILTEVLKHFMLHFSKFCPIFNGVSTTES